MIRSPKRRGTEKFPRRDYFHTRLLPLPTESHYLFRPNAGRRLAASLYAKAFCRHDISTTLYKLQTQSTNPGIRPRPRAIRNKLRPKKIRKPSAMVNQKSRGVSIFFTTPPPLVPISPFFTAFTSARSKTISSAHKPATRATRKMFNCISYKYTTKNNNRPLVCGYRFVDIGYPQNLNAANIRACKRSGRLGRTCISSNAEHAAYRLYEMNRTAFASCSCLRIRMIIFHLLIGTATCEMKGFTTLSNAHAVGQHARHWWKS